MKVIKPVKVTEAVYSASNMPEPDSSQSEVEWTDNLNGSKYPIQSNSTSIASSSSADYVTRFSTSTEINEYVNGVLNYSKTLTLVNSIVSDSHYHDGNVYMADLTDIRYYNVSTKVEGTAIVSGGVESGTVFTSITSVGSTFYIYDRVNKKVKVYELSGNVLTHQEDIEVDIDGKYPKLTQISGGGFLVLNKGVASTYSDRFTLISEQSLPRLTYIAEAYGGIANNGTEFRAISTINNENNIERYDYELVYQGFYLPKERVIKTSTHKVYECAIATDLDPETAINNVPPEWVEVKTTNKFALVDTKVFSPSISATPITISLTPGEIVDSLAAFELVNVTTVDISAVSAASGSVYSNTVTLNGYPEFVDMDIPPFSDLTITITFNGSDIEVGEVVTGLAYDIGKLLVGVQDATKDYSRQEFDEFGNLEFVKRPIVNQTTYPIAVAKDQAFNVKRLLNSLRGTAAVWVGDTGGGFLLTTYGYVERAPMVYDNQSVVKYQIKVRGSI